MRCERGEASVKEGTGARQPQEVKEGGGRKEKERVLSVLDPEHPHRTPPPKPLQHKIVRVCVSVQAVFLGFS